VIDEVQQSKSVEERDDRLTKNQTSYVRGSIIDRTPYTVANPLCSAAVVCFLFGSY